MLEEKDDGERATFTNKSEISENPVKIKHLPDNLTSINADPLVDKSSNRSDSLSSHASVFSGTSVRSTVTLETTKARQEEVWEKNRFATMEKSHCQLIKLIPIWIIMAFLIFSKLFQGNKNLDSIVGVGLCSSWWFVMFVFFIIVAILISIISFFICIWEYESKH